MKVVSGWHCPDLLTGPGNYLRKNVDAELALALITGARTAIQAGGHIGTWPVYLAPRFERVITFEPEDENFASLVKNLAERAPSTIAYQGILAAKPGEYSLRISPKSTGQHQVGKGKPVRAFVIDELGLADVDAIFLDVEGFEVAALQGASETIRRSRPVIMAEENKRALDHGYRLGDVERLLRPFGYRKVAAVNEDLVFAPE